MKNFFPAFFSAICVWGYYRLGWIRASALGIKVDWRARISPGSKLIGVAAIGNASIGRNVKIQEGSYMSSGVIDNAEIGPYVSIGPDVIIGPSEHRLDFWTTSPYEAKAAGEDVTRTEKANQVSIIGRGAWLGAKVVVLQGAVIGERSVIAAGAVVKGVVPDGEIWGGVPAKKIGVLAGVVDQVYSE